MISSQCTDFERYVGMRAFCALYGQTYFVHVLYEKTSRGFIIDCPLGILYFYKILGLVQETLGEISLGKILWYVSSRSSEYVIVI